MSGYGFHPAARDDLEDIRSYIARDSADAADRVVDRIVDSVAALARFHQQGHRRADLTSRPLRFWRVYDYLIAYAPDESPLWVVGVLHGRRDPRMLAAILRSRAGRDTH